MWVTTWVTMPDLIADGQAIWAYVWRSAGKKWVPRVPPTFKITQNHRNWQGSIRYL